ncbi:MAG: T9SS type A sorting domain-containing protein [Bacteroidia bacterium]|nr:T9SS type A sorting domain-containing protein [Bacteroidia bacterium]MDW8089214.1 T9SS type A sorting domain-containing protein [Bacteroidia bacterium]
MQGKSGYGDGLLGLLLALGVAWAQSTPLQGVYQITGVSDFANRRFATIQEAFDSLNQRGAQGDVVIRLTPASAWNPANEPSTITLVGYNCINCRVSVMLQRQDTLRKAPATTSGGRFIFRFGGTTQSNLSNPLNHGQLRNFSLSGTGVFALKSTQNASNSGTTTGLIGIVSTQDAPLNLEEFTIDGFILLGFNRAQTFSGIYLGSDPATGNLVSAPLTPGSTVRGLRISSNRIDSVSRPIMLRGSSSALLNSIEVEGNQIGRAATDSWAATFNIGGIHLFWGRGIQIIGNQITGATSGSITAANQLAGVRLDTCENFTIARNWIYGLRYTGTDGRGQYGICVILPATLQASSQNRIFSNMIADIVGDARTSTTGAEYVSGIFVNAANDLTDAKLAIYHNSIHLYGNNSVISAQSEGSSAAITIGHRIAGGLVISGNILQNSLRVAQNGTRTAYGLLFFSTSLSGAQINHNAYRIAAQGIPNYVARVGNTNYATLSAWRASASGREANGFFLPDDVPFVSPTDLHLVSTTPTPVINAGDAAYNGTLDFDGQARPIGGVGSDPGTAPDIGADELAGTRPPCPPAPFAPSVITPTPPQVGTAYLWGTVITLDTSGTNQPPLQGEVEILYSLDNGTTWQGGGVVSGFPTTFVLPPLTPPIYTGTIRIALVARMPSGCPNEPPDTSNVALSLNLTDRPGNRPSTAIPLALSYNSATGYWEASVQDSTSGPAISNEYGESGATGVATNPRGTGARDLFFRLTLPVCLDSLRLNTCDEGTTFGTRLSLINLTLPDTTSDEDQGSTCSAAGFSDPHFTAHILAIGRLGSQRIKPMPENPQAPTRDTIPLREGDELLIIVEGFNAASQGRFRLSLTGYPTPPFTRRPDLGADRLVCVSAGTLPLDGSAEGATTYRWLVNNQPVSGATGPIYTLNLAVGNYTVIVQAIRENPQPPVCRNDTTADTLSVTVSPQPDASIAVGDRTYTSGDTYTLTGTPPTVQATFEAASTTVGNAYDWEVYNPGATTPSATGNQATFTHTFTQEGRHTLILRSRNGACEERDTLYVEVVLRPSALLSAGGEFAIFPNPAHATLHLIAPRTGTYSLAFYDLTGKVVATYPFEGREGDIALSLPAGLYLLTITEESAPLWRTHLLVVE